MRASFESEGDESLELSSTLGDNHREQEQALLEKDETDVEPPQRHVHTRRWIWYGFIAVLAIFGSVATAIIILRGNKTTKSNSGQDEAVSHQRSDDYILDPSWDFKAAPTRREYFWTITDEIGNPDGVYRPMILINQQFPGPLIEVNEGDTVVVHVSNQAANATAIHWHGIYHNGTNWMDGTSGVTQCPIAPGLNFTYEFKLDGQSGTYWYHAHHGAQTSDGLLGPLIIHSKDEKSLQKIEYATDRVVMVQDYYHDISSSLLVKYLEPDNENAEPVPDGALINGQNWRNCTKMPNRECDATNASIPIFNLTPNENHRLRIINVGAFAEFQMQWDEHEFAVTEVDGTDVYPEYFHRLNINPAQRYSIVLSANNTNATSFWLRARMVTSCFAEPNDEMEAEVRAIINYQSASDSSSSVTTPTSRDWPEVIELECHDLNVSSLHPVVEMAAPSKPDASIYIRSNFEIGAHRLSRGFFNHSSFKPNLRSPVLHRIVSDLSGPANTSIISPVLAPPSGALNAPPAPQNNILINSAAFDLANEMVLQTPRKAATLDLIFTNFDDGEHPIHLHGHKFFLLGQGKGYPPQSRVDLANASPEQLEQAILEGLDLSNPLRRDTASVPAYGWVHIRVVLDNPGVWLLHCHVAWHFEAGMGMVVAVAVEDIMDQIEQGHGGWVDAVTQSKQMCEAAGVETGTRPDDDLWSHA